MRQGSEVVWDEGAAMVGRGRVHYRTARPAGRGSRGARVVTLVLLHEGLGSAGLWRDFPERLLDALGAARPDLRIEVLAYSRHGYGRSSVVPEARTPRYMHDEATEVLPELLSLLGIATPVLVGHSDGASIALLHAAAGHPVRALVLFAPHVFVEPCTVAAAEEIAAVFEHGELAARMARHHDDPVATFRGWNDIWRSAAFADWNIEASLPAITAPVLLVQGADDRYGTVAQLDAIEAGVCGACERVLLEGVGHAPHLDAPADTLAAAVSFLSQHA